MANPGWMRPESRFHSGELAIQARMGVQEKMDKQGRRVIREYLPQQFRDFFAQLPYSIVGTVDASGNIWASILLGEPGFISSPSDRALQVSASPLFGDPLANNIAVGIDIGLLGIELHTRRRNRVNGKVVAVDGDRFEIEIGQCFGNCPQYIQARTWEFEAWDARSPKNVRQIFTFGEMERSIISEADTFFIATAYQSKLAGTARGVDVAHRGGNPGFIRIDNDSTLTIPDFSGNNHFNTFGNLELNPHAGLLFVDFKNGNLLYLTGTARIIWDSEEILGYRGAERLLRFELEQGYLVEGSIPPWRSLPEFSPYLAGMGSW